MLPPIGTTCTYTFTKAFASLNGVYNTLSVSTFEAAISNGVDFTTSLYTPAGMNKTDYENDYASYKGVNVVELQSVKDSTVVLYVPEPVIALNPDPTVQKYHQIYYAAYIGAFKDPTVYSYIKSRLDDIIASVTGVTEGGKWLANPDYDIYLTEKQYEDLDATRQAAIKQLKPLSTQLQDQLTLIASLQSRIDALEQKLLDSTQT